MLSVGIVASFRCIELPEGNTNLTRVPSSAFQGQQPGPRDALGADPEGGGLDRNLPAHRNRAHLRRQARLEERRQVHRAHPVVEASSKCLRL